MKNNWLWKKSPVMWVPWIQYIVNYFILLPAMIIGVILLLVGFPSLFAHEYSTCICGIILIVVAAVVHFILDGKVIDHEIKN